MRVYNTYTLPHKINNSFGGAHQRWRRKLAGGIPVRKKSGTSLASISIMNTYKTLLTILIKCSYFSNSQYLYNKLFIIHTRLLYSFLIIDKCFLKPGKHL